MLESIAKMKDMEYRPLSEEKRSEIENEETVKSVWLLQDKAFVEQPVRIGISDDAYYEISEGLQGNETLIIDTIEPDTMQEFFQQFFGKGLTD